MRALYCIFRYNAYHLPLPMQFLIYVLIGGASALVNLAVFLVLLKMNLPFTLSTISAFVMAAATNYYLCVTLLFRHKVRWSSTTEILVYGTVVALVGAVDLGIMRLLYALGYPAWLSKSTASLVGLVFNFVGRRFWVFPEKGPTRLASVGPAADG